MEWNDFFISLKSKKYYQDLLLFLDNEYKSEIIYPKKEDIFNAFKLTPFNKIKVVIIGQDPYINENEAMGLAFSVKEGVKLPPSLKNIYLEIENEFNIMMDFSNGDLTYLAKQGVFLINPILTVKKGLSLSHNNSYYHQFFIDLLDFIDQYNDNPIVFMLWGNKAKSYKKHILNKNRLILETAHPSPLAANNMGWFNSFIFKKANEYLKANKQKEINWSNNIFFN